MWNSKDFEAIYSPKSINDIVYPNEYSKTLIEQLVTGARPFPIPAGKCGILLHGIPGTGKSALAKLLPGAIEMHLSGDDAKSDTLFCSVQQGNNGLKLLKNIDDNAHVFPWSASQHYYILDEVDNLNKEGGCTEFCVNGLMAGNRRTSWREDDRKFKESSTQRAHRQFAG